MKKSFRTIVIILFVFALLAGTALGLIYLYKDSSGSSTVPATVSGDNSVKRNIDARFSNISLPEHYNEELTVSVLSDSLSVKPLEAQAATKEDDGENKVKYTDAFHNTDIVQTLSSSKVKEDIILKQPGHPDKFEYKISLDQYDFEKNGQGDFVFYEKGKMGQDGYKKFTILAPFMIDAKGKKSLTSDVKSALSLDGILTVEPNGEWLSQAAYPVTLDPTIEINILNVHSHPQTGENWEVDFTTLGQSDLKIVPNDQATVVDDEFTELWCGSQQKTPQILKGDVIYYPHWQCSETAKVVHKTLKAGKHTLRFEFADKVVYAYNNSDYFTSSGTWNAPAGITHVQVECWGGGGGGGSFTVLTGGGGGGGGAYSKKNSISVTPGNGYAVNIGIGGTGGSYASSGAAGGDSNFIDASTLLAKGGGGGIVAGSGGTGGQSGSCVGDVKYSGGNGASGGFATGGGGGGGAGDANIGGNASGSTGGTGGVKMGGNGGDNNNPGSSGSAIGGGGSGSMGDGGSGAGGQCIITYRYDNIPIIFKNSSSSSVINKNVIIK